MSGNCVKKISLRIISAGVCSLLVVTSVVPSTAYAARSRAGGGEVAQFTATDFVTTVGLSLGSAVVGSALSSAVGSGWTALKAGGDVFSSMGTGITSSLSNSFTLANMSVGYSTVMASSQVGRAVSNAGVFYKWDPGATYLASAVASGVAGGLCNFNAALGNTLTKSMEDISISTLARGAFVGGLTQLGAAGVTVAIDGDKIAKGEQPGAGAQIAGMAAGVFAGSLGRIIVNPATYNMSVSPKEVTKTDQTKMVDSEYKDMKRALLPVMDQGQSPTMADLSSIHNSPGTRLIDTDGSKSTFSHFAAKGDGAGGVVYTLDNESAAKLENSRIAPVNLGADRSVMYMPDGNGPSGGQIAERILVGPFVETANLWPTIAGNAAGILAADGIKNQSLQMAVKSVVSALVTPTLDVAATAYSLKPSLATNVDTDMGYYPELKYAQQKAFLEEERATAKELAKGFDTNGIDPNNQVETKAKVAEYLRANGVKEEFVDKMSDACTSAMQAQKNMTNKESFYKGAIYDGVQTVITAKERGISEDWVASNFKGGTPDYSGVIEDVGSSKGGMVVDVLKQTFKRDLPVQLISGGMQYGAGTLAGQNNPMRGMIVGWAGSLATGVARGVVWGLYNQSKGKDEAAMAENFLNGQIAYMDRTAFSYQPQSNAQRIDDRLSGASPMPDKTPYVVTSSELRGSRSKDPISADKAEVLNKNGFGWLITTDKPGELLRARQEIQDSMSKKDDRTSRNLIAVNEVLNDVQQVVTYAPATSAQKTDSSSAKLYKVSDNTFSADTDKFIKRDNGVIIRPSDENYASVAQSLKSPTDASNTQAAIVGSTKDGYNIAPFGGWKLDGEDVKVVEVAKRPGMTDTILGSVGQSLYEFGVQTFSMGLPQIENGKLPLYSWYNYSQNLASTSRTAASKGIWEAMAYKGAQVGMDLTERNVLTAVANTPLGAVLGMAPVETFTGYRGMPFSAGVNVPLGDGHETRFYKTWPYAPGIRPVFSDPKWIGIQSRLPGAADTQVPSMPQGLYGSNGSNDVTNPVNNPNPLKSPQQQQLERQYR